MTIDTNNTQQTIGERVTAKIKACIDEYPHGVTVTQITQECQITGKTARKYLGILVSNSPKYVETPIDGNTTLYHRSPIVTQEDISIRDPILPEYIHEWSEKPSDSPYKQSSFNVADVIYRKLTEQRPVVGFINPVDWEIVKHLVGNHTPETLETLLYDDLGRLTYEDSELIERMESINVSEIAVTQSFDYYHQSLYTQQHPTAPELSGSRAAAYDILKQNHRAMKPPEVASQCDFAPRTIRRAMSNLAEDKIINQRKIGHNHVIYYTEPIPSNVVGILPDNPQSDGPFRDKDALNTFLESGLLCFKKGVSPGNQFTHPEAYEYILETYISKNLYPISPLSVPHPQDIAKLTENLNQTESVDTFRDVGNAYLEETERTIEEQNSWHPHRSDERENQETPNRQGVSNVEDGIQYFGAGSIHSLLLGYCEPKHLKKARDVLGMTQIEVAREMIDCGYTSNNNNTVTTVSIKVSNVENHETMHSEFAEKLKRVYLSLASEKRAK